MSGLKILCILIFSVASCTSPQINSEFLRITKGFTKQLVPTQNFTLTTYYHFKDNNSTSPVNIYIEGDGVAWVNKYKLSTNPTPKEPFVLRLASLDPSPNVLYIARPCQYTPLETELNCNSSYWSGARFSEEVIESIMQAIKYYNEVNHPINLIGYSGGALIAMIIATKIDNVQSIRTIAGNLDHIALHQYHHVTQLKNSLNLIDYIKQIENIPQHHYLGKNDKIIPAFITYNFIKKYDHPNCITIFELEKTSHYQGWEKIWPSLIGKEVSCKN